MRTRFGKRLVSSAVTQILEARRLLSAPTDLIISYDTVLENNGSGTTVGDFSLIDDNVGGTYALVPGEGDEGNSLFRIAGNHLKVDENPDYANRLFYTIRVRGTDTEGLSVERVFTIYVQDVPSPGELILSNASVAENQPSGTFVADISVFEDPQSASYTYALVAGPSDTGNSSFSVTGTQLFTAASFDYETQNTYTIRLQVTNTLGRSVQKLFAIRVTNEDEAPTDVTLSASTVDESAVPVVVGTLGTTDGDVLDTFTYTFATGAGDTDNGLFEIVSGQLRTLGAVDYETKSSYGVRITSTDSGGLSFTKAFTINVNDINEAPTDIALSNSTLAENLPAGTVLGTLSATDPDGGETFTYALTAGTGDGDNDLFEIVGDEVRAVGALDFEAQSAYSIRVTATDSGGLTYTKTFAITLTDVQEAPTDIAVTPSSIDENMPAGSVVGDLSATDQDAGSTFTYELTAGEGDTDNAIFEIVAGQLRALQSFNYEVKGSYSVRITATDDDGLSFSKAITINVTDIDDAPIAGTDTADTRGRSRMKISILANDSALDMSAVTVALGTLPTVGSVILNPDGTVTYFAVLGYVGADPFTYTLTDINGTRTGTVNVNVTIPSIANVEVNGTGIGNEISVFVVDNVLRIEIDDFVRQFQYPAVQTITVLGLDGDDVISVEDSVGLGVTISGGRGADTITGGIGADSLVGCNGDDVISGRGGADSIDGGAGDDSIFGNGGADLLVGVIGAEVISGGAGNDLIYGGQSSDTINGDDGEDVIYGGDFGDLVDGGVGQDTIVGELGDDSLYGGDGADVIGGNAGTDVIKGNAGTDLLFGGMDNDDVSGGIDADILQGDPGDDVINGAAGNDRIVGLEGNDSCEGGTGADSLYGGDGNDTLLGGDGNDFIAGGLGNDSLASNEGSDTLYGDEGDDVLNTVNTDPLGDTLAGNAGDDTGYRNANDVLGGIEHDNVLA